MTCAAEDTYTLQANKIGEGTYGSVAIGVHNSAFGRKHCEACILSAHFSSEPLTVAASMFYYLGHQVKFCATEQIRLFAPVGMWADLGPVCTEAANDGLTMQQVRKAHPLHEQRMPLTEGPSAATSGTHQQRAIKTMSKANMHLDVNY